MILTISSQDFRGIAADVLDEEGLWLELLVPAELLDDEVGDNSSRSERQAWVLQNSELIRRAAIAKRDGGFVRAPFHGIRLKEAQ
jgi:hypothetical protein